MPDKTLDPQTHKLIVEIDETGQAPTQSFSSNPETQYPTLGILPNATPKALRRKRASSKAGFINFYDLGLLKPEGGGDYQDRDLSVLLTLDQAKNQLEETVAFIQAQARPKLNAPLNIALSSWKTRFKKLEKAELGKYKFAILTEGEIDYENPNVIPVNEDNPDVTEKGLKFDKIDKLLLISDYFSPPPYTYYMLGGSFENILDFSKIKVTNAPTYDSPAKSLNVTPKNGAVDIYINPAFFYTGSQKYTDLGATGSETVGSPGGAGYFVYYFEPPPVCEATRRFPAAPVTSINTVKQSTKWLNYFVTTWRRSQILEPNPKTTTQEGGGDIVRIFTEEMRKHPQARALDELFTATSTGIRYIPTSTEPFFPIYASARCGVPPASSSGSSSITESALSPESYPVDEIPSTNEWTYRVEGGLIAVINQKSDWFFLWSNIGGIQ